MEPVYISIKDACALSSLGRTSLYAAIKASRLPALKRGTRRLIRRSDLVNWIERGDHDA